MSQFVDVLRPTWPVDNAFCAIVKGKFSCLYHHRWSTCGKTRKGLSLEYFTKAISLFSGKFNIILPVHDLAHGQSVPPNIWAFTFTLVWLLACYLNKQTTTITTTTSVHDSSRTTATEASSSFKDFGSNVHSGTPLLGGCDYVTHRVAAHNQHLIFAWPADQSEPKGAFLGGSCAATGLNTECYRKKARRDSAAVYSMKKIMCS